MRPEVISNILGCNVQQDIEELEITGTEARVCMMIAQRQKLGLAKYKISVEDNPLTLRQWHQHHLEELLDAAVYTQRIIEQMDKDCDDGK